MKSEPLRKGKLTHFYQLSCLSLLKLPIPMTTSFEYQLDSPPLVQSVFGLNCLNMHIFSNYQFPFLSETGKCGVFFVFVFLCYRWLKQDKNHDIRLPVALKSDIGTCIKVYKHWPQHFDAIYWLIQVFCILKVYLVISCYKDCIDVITKNLRENTSGFEWIMKPQPLKMNQNHT